MIYSHLKWAKTMICGSSSQTFESLMCYQLKEPEVLLLYKSTGHLLVEINVCHHVKDLVMQDNVPVCSGTQKEQHQDSFSNMAVFLFKSCYTKRYCACLISMCFRGMLHHTCITCHNIHHISPFTTYCFS